MRHPPILSVSNEKPNVGKNGGNYEPVNSRANGRIVLLEYFLT